MRFLGIDLGGTNIKVALLEGADSEQPPSVLATSTHPTGAWKGPGAVTERLIELGRAAIDEHGAVVSAGLGVPGLFEADTGRITLFPNLPGPWAGQPLLEPVAEALGVPTAMVNDARAFTLAEGTIGAGRGCRTIVCLTLGTGIGGGVMIEGRLHLGAFGTAGEIGHQTVLPDGPRCGCGNRGCVEALAKAEVLAQRANRSSAEEVYAGARDGDRDCRAAIREVAAWIGIGLANTVAVLGPDRIVVGGGIIDAGDLVLDPIRQAVRERVTLVPTDRIEVVAAELGSMAGAIGAAIAGRDQAPVRSL